MWQVILGNFVTIFLLAGVFWVFDHEHMIHWNDELEEPQFTKSLIMNKLPLIESEFTRVQVRKFLMEDRTDEELKKACKRIDEIIAEQTRVKGEFVNVT